jgi:hypothetical protein
VPPSAKDRLTNNWLTNNWLTNNWLDQQLADQQLAGPTTGWTNNWLTNNWLTNNWADSRRPRGETLATARREIKHMFDKSWILSLGWGTTSYRRSIEHSFEQRLVEQVQRSLDRRSGAGRLSVRPRH